MLFRESVCEYVRGCVMSIIELIKRICQWDHGFIYFLVSGEYARTLHAHTHVRYFSSRIPATMILVLITAIIPATPVMAAREPLPYPSSLLDDLRSPDVNIRLSAVQAIKPYRETGSLKALMDLVQSDPEPAIRLQAIGAIWNRGNPKSAKPLEIVLVLDKDRDVRMAAAGALGDIGQMSSAIFLVNTLMSTKDPELAAICLRSLGELGDHSSINTVINYLEMENTIFVRGTAARTLGKMRSERAANPLINTLENDPDPTVRSLAAQSLGLIGDPSSHDSLIRGLLFDKSDVVRFRSAEALTLFRINSNIHQAFIEGLRDSDKRVRYICLKALSGGIRKSEIPVVGELLADDMPGIRDIAHQILGKKGVVMEKVGDRYRLVE